MSYSPNFRGNNGKGSSRQVSSGFQNGAGSTLIKSRPVSQNSSGQIVGIDISDETLVKNWVGLCSEDITNAATGQVVDSGRVEDITISYPVNTPIYVSKSGFLTSSVPVAGSNGYLIGDFVLFVGVIVRNEFDNSKKDIKLMRSIIGQL